MTIEDIRKLSLEYAKGHVQTGPAWRKPSKRKRRTQPGRQETYAEWFARSLKGGKGGPPSPSMQIIPPNRPRPIQSPPSGPGTAVAIDHETDAYRHQDPGDDGIPPW